MKTFILAIIAVLTSGPTLANEDFERFNTFDASLRSYHIADRCYSKCSKTYNESNYGLGFTATMTKHSEITLGFLENSFYQQSFYGTVNFMKALYLTNGIVIKPSLALGMANGYKGTPGKLANEDGIVPVVSPNISLYVSRIHFNLGVLPSAATAVAIFRAGVRF